jgi:squalene synthase HpnC
LKLTLCRLFAEAPLPWMTSPTQSVTLAGAPPEYALPATRPTLAEAQAWCRHLATSHYENFHVATWFLPRRARPYFESIYAFSRAADDLGDEVADRATATQLLGEWRALLDQCYDSPAESTHPVFVALHETIVATEVPRQLFADLITAFEMDQTLTHHESMESLVEYSRLSANPVGRLVLWVSGYRDEARGLLSDKVCTALQLANFWQDVVEDWERGRRYLPACEMQRFGVTDADIADKNFTPQFEAMMQSLVEYAGSMLREGGAVADAVDAELAVTLRLFEGGGRAALDGIIAQDYNVLARRPSVSKFSKFRLLAGALLGKARGIFAPRGARA